MPVSVRPDSMCSTSVSDRALRPMHNRGSIKFFALSTLKLNSATVPEREIFPELIKSIKRPSLGSSPRSEAMRSAAGTGRLNSECRRSKDGLMIDSLAALTADIIDCFRCPRLVAWREHVAATKRAAFRDWDYWGRPVPGYGDPEARLVVIGLAPAAHGGNRTGRIFTGDRSGDWLYGAMYRAGFANQPTSVSRDDGLKLRDAYVLAAVRCAPPDNKPSIEERDNCQPYMTRELALLPRTRVFVCLGTFAYDNLARLLGLRPKPRFGHGAEAVLPDGRVVLCSYHPSQQNTFTGRLTEEMFDSIFSRARQLIEGT